ncbi:MAG: hypothetical protein NTV06_05420 [candidate division Zixibacteria bacterium]|nr:hypothetical protein [candidate division Zixibacteria bacterium]
MNSVKLIFFIIALLVLISSNLVAQEDKFGAIDTIYVEPYKIDTQHWGINISMFNDEDIIGICIPLKLKAENNRVVADSTIFTGGRAESFRVKIVRTDTAKQCVTIGLIADLGVSVPPMAPGKGRIATVFVSSLDNNNIISLEVDSITTTPNNSLQLIKAPSDGIIPVFIVKKESQKMIKKTAIKETVTEVTKESEKKTK